MSAQFCMVKTNPAKKYLPLFLLIVGPLLVALSVSHNILRLRSLTLNRQTVAAYQEVVQEETESPFPTHIYSQYFLDIDIDPAEYREGEWTISPNHASYLVSSGRPGQPGNIILYGHNKREILGNIRAFKGGETITLTLADGTTRDYRVAKLAEVAPTQVDLLQPTEVETLTIYTCSGFLDSQRFVVQAIPLDQAGAR